MKKFLILFLFVSGLSISNVVQAQRSAEDFGNILFESFQEGNKEKLMGLMASVDELEEKIREVYYLNKNTDEAALNETIKEIKKSYDDQVKSMERRYDQIKKDAESAGIDFSACDVTDVVSVPRKVDGKVPYLTGEAELLDIVVKFTDGEKEHQLDCKNNFELDGLIKMGGKPDLMAGK